MPDRVFPRPNPLRAFLQLLPAPDALLSVRQELRVLSFRLRLSLKASRGSSRQIRLGRGLLRETPSALAQHRVLHRRTRPLRRRRGRARLPRLPICYRQRTKRSFRRSRRTFPKTNHPLQRGSSIHRSSLLILRPPRSSRTESRLAADVPLEQARGR